MSCRSLRLDSWPEPAQSALALSSSGESHMTRLREAVLRRHRRVSDQYVVVTAGPGTRLTSTADVAVQWRDAEV